MPANDARTLMAEARRIVLKRYGQFTFTMAGAALATGASLLYGPSAQGALASLLLFSVAVVLWILMNGAARLPVVVEGAALVLYPLDVTQVRGGGMPPAIPLTQLELIAFRDVMRHAEDAPGRVHWYELVVRSPGGKPITVSTLREPAAAQAIMAAVAERDAPGSHPEIQRALAFWDEPAGKFKTLGGAG